MAVIKSSDFQKVSSGGPYAGETRDNIFELKIKNKKQFVLGATKSGKKVLGISYNKKTRELTYQDAKKELTVKFLSLIHI